MFRLLTSREKHASFTIRPVPAMAFSGASPAGGGALGQGDVGPPLASAFASPGQEALGGATLSPWAFPSPWVGLFKCLLFSFVPGIYSYSLILLHCFLFFF